MWTFFRIALSFTVFASLAAPVALVARATPSPTPAIDEKADLVLSAARAFATLHARVAHVSYRVVVSLTSDAGVIDRRTYESAYDGATQVVYANSISEEERSHPIVPRGFNVVISSSASTSTGSTGTGTRVGRPLDESDVLGAPVLAPTYSFGLARTSDRQNDVTDSGLRTIARTRVLNRDYYASYLGEEAVAGETCSHVRLAPVNHPERYRLRELWVAADGAPLRATTHGNFTARPWDGIDWTITCRRDGGVLYLDSETTQESVRIDRLRRGRVTVSFQDVTPYSGSTRFLLQVDPFDAVREPT